MTLPLELIARIRRLHYAEHWKVGTIVAQLGIHHDAVERALGLDSRSGLKSEGLLARRVPPSVVDPYKPFIGQTLENYPRLRATRIFEMVKARGYVGGYDQIKVYVRQVRPRPKSEAFFRLETLPGEQAQVDWGLFGKLRVGNAERSLCCFVLVLSHSRALFGRFALDMTLESFLRGHVRAFEALGGVPRNILYDNLKSVVLERSGDAIRFHPRLLELAGHYHFQPRPCAPYRGNEKGKVERTIRYIRDAFFAARRFSSVADLNSQLVHWVNEVAHTRPWPGAPDGRRVLDVFLEEKSRLLPLPQGAFSTDVMRAAVSQKTPYIRFDGNDYSLPPEFIRRPLTLAASEEWVRLLDGTQEVARHTRSYDKGQRIEDEAHLAALAAQKRRAASLRGRDVLRATLTHADAFIGLLSVRGHSLGHETSRLLRLVREYGPREVNAAMEEALAKGAVSAASVAHLLEGRARKRKQPPRLDVVVPESVRHIQVTPHSLADYDVLLGKKREGQS